MALLIIVHKINNGSLAIIDFMHVFSFQEDQ